MRKVGSLANRLVALILSIVMVISMLPISAAAVSSSEISTTLGDADYVVGQPAEFTVTTVGNDDTDAMVLGSFEIQENGSAVNITDIATLEYRDSSTGNWYEFVGDFGPAATGFPLQAAATTSNFRVTFSKDGEYTVKVFIKKFSDSTELCAVEKTVSVAPASPATITTTLGEQSYTVGQQAEFTVTTVGNKDTGAMVLGSFEIQENGSAVNITDIATLEYRDSATGNWYEFVGDFGPAATGFPLQAAATTSNFRVTFSKDGEYTVKVFIKKFADGTELCGVTENITVSPMTQAVLNTDIGEKTFEINQEVEVSYQTIANDYEQTLVLGTFVVTKDGVDAKDCVASLEYWDVNTQSWQSFYGDFGPAGGFPLTNATSRFRVKFKETGTYSVEAKIVQAESREVLAANTTEIEVKDTIAPEIVEITGNANDWTNESVYLTVVANDNSGSVFEYSLDGEIWQEENVFVIDENGSYIFYAKDAAGNISAASESVEVTYIDKAAPVIGQITFDPDTWTNQTVTITVYATDFGVNGISYKMDDGEWQSENTFEITDTDTHYIYVKDSLDNVSPSPMEVVADKYDTVAPIINSVTPDTTDWVNNQVTIVVDAEDAGAKGITYKLDDGEWQADNKFVITQNGTYTVYVKDCLDNENQNPETITISNIDNVIPVIETFTSTTEAWTNGDVTISGNVSDDLSGYASVYWRQGNSTTENAATLNADGTYTFTVPAQDYEGPIYIGCYDFAKNKAAEKNVTVQMDITAPIIDIQYNAKSAENTTVQFVDASKATVESFADGAQAYYNGDVNATISITENNFFEGKQITDAAGNPSGEIVHCVGILLTKTDDNGVVTKTEYLPAGANKLFDEADNTVEFSWKRNGNVYTYTIPYAQNADYQITVFYTDFSENGAEISANDGTVAKARYTSKIVTVDKAAPIVTVDYQNNDLKATHGDRKYYTENQTAVITVREHNFRAEDFVATVTAKYSDASDVSVEDFAAILADDSKWVHNGNEHKITLNYVVDANYTFDYTYEDLAQNDAAAYAEDAFTVDKQNPHTPTVKYEGDVKLSVIDKVLNVLTLGYYNAKVKVTITADDDVAGIDHFVYSYTKNAGVSNVNASLEPTTIESTNIVQNGKTFTATFEIPKDVLAKNNQFNGTVNFIAYDRATRSNAHQETATIIVDNIAPTAKITYNAPVQTANGISYYDGNINTTIVITEANFDAKDVVVSVTKNGAAFPVNVTWRDDNVDTHTGTFTLTDDGDYFVSVQYKDKSVNQMASYTSNELTLDATKPTIKVSGIKANSANKDEKYGFMIEVNDTNLDTSSIKPVLKAVVQKEDGVYAAVEVDLGDAKTVVNGQTYSYTVENLPDDGLYTLICEVKDMSANGMSQIVLDDGEAYDQVQFSINRNGSVFGYGSQYTEKLVGKYYIYSIDEDVEIVEVNVDPIEQYKVTLNGKDLAEGTDYTTVQTSEDGEWSKRTYTIKKSLFETEGEYSIIVSSTDKADTTAFSDVKNLSLAFVVDQTKPVLTITGLKTGGRYQTDAQTVTLIPTDEGGRLNSLSVVVLDSNGNPLKDDNDTDISVRFEMSGEELLKYLEENDGKVTFTIPTGLNNQVKIICNDCAVNAEDLTNEYNELFERVTVSQNQFVIFYANTPLFVGSIVGVLAVIALIIFLIKRKNTKKNKAKAKV